MNWIYVILGYTGYLVLLYVLYRNKRYKQHRVFTLLVLEDALQTPILMSLYQWGSSQQYYNAYWSLELLDIFLRVTIIILCWKAVEQAFFLGFKYKFHAPVITFGLILYTFMQVITFLLASQGLWLLHVLRPLYILLLFGWAVVLWREENPVPKHMARLYDLFA